MASAGFAGLVALAAATVCLASGCSTLGYYAHSVGGHLDLLRSARPVPLWMGDDSAPPLLKERLALAQRIRDFAVSELKEPDNASYRRYADLHRTAAVWNVVAAPELSLKLKTWCFPVVGCVGYRGYFDRAKADALLSSLVTTSSTRFVSPSLTSMVRAALGDLDGAIADMERAIDARAVEAIWIEVRPAYARLRADSRFATLIARREAARHMASPTVAERI